MQKKEILQWLTAPDAAPLFERARAVMNAHVGSDVYVRGIIEFSNYCRNNCLYCGLRRDNRQLRRYRMTSREIAAVAGRITAAGIKTIVLQSGDDFSYSYKDICRIIEGIKKSHNNVAVTLSVGERPPREYDAFKQSGADRYLLKHETINPELYERLHPGQSLKHRLAILSYLKELGFQVGTGNIIGLPGQTPEDLAEELSFMSRLQPHMIGSGPFVPQADTPLRGSVRGDAALTLRFLALIRLHNPLAHLPATTALHTIDPDQGLRRALRAGCNVVMPDYTPPEFSEHYTIYDNKQKIHMETVVQICAELGRKISFTRGDSVLAANR
jgi:biotin synthase